MDFYSLTFGPFAWGQVSYLEEPIFGGGMEHVSVISMEESAPHFWRELRMVSPTE